MHEQDFQTCFCLLLLLLCSVHCFRPTTEELLLINI
jgi:hypothetical protein